MNHIEYQLALIHRDELLRRADERRRAKQVPSTPVAVKTLRGEPPKVRWADGRRRAVPPHSFRMAAGSTTSDPATR